MDDRFDLSALIEEFREEARQQLNHVDAALLRIEETQTLSEEERLELLRVLHTLKGNSGMVGLKRIADQVHALETIFKSGLPSGGQRQLDAMFELSAALRSAVERLGTPAQEAALERLASVDLPAAAESPDSSTDISDSGPAEGEPESREDADAAARPDSPSSSAEPVVPGARRPARQPADDETLTGAGQLSGTEVVRVPFAKLDRLLAEVGELVGLHARLENFIDTHRSELQPSGLYRELQAELEDLALRTNELRETTMELRLVPLRTVFGPFPGLVREIAREQGKRARLETEGEHIEVDKSAADALSEPLLHLLRNAVDHGLESPEERRDQGKDETGRIRLIAMREGDHIRIEVSDDGSGLDRAAILRRAREIGAVGDEDELSPDEVRKLIFRPGFSTRVEASTVSGRGMGLDIVHRGVLRLRGSLHVERPEDGGTRFVLRLPLTLAIVPALIFESDGEILALPATEVSETLPRSFPERAGGTEVVRQGEDLVPVARPKRLFGWPSDGAQPPGTDADSPSRPQFAIVLRRGTRAAAITADRLIDQREVVVKALPTYLGAVRGVSGATVAPDGRVILLLDSQGVLDLNMETQRRPAREQ